MARTASDVVTEFCRLWSKPDPDKMIEYFTEDAVYHNIPMPLVAGRAAIKEFIEGFVAHLDGIDFVVHRQLGDSGLVMNERTDIMRFKNETSIELPVMGVFEVADGRITAWRDYFDLAMATPPSP